MQVTAAGPLVRAASAEVDIVRPEVGSHPGWPLVLYFHHVRSDLDHYTVLQPAEFAFALDLLGRWFRPMDPRDLAGAPADWSYEPTCLLTFDDGYLDVWEHAVPLMEERGWRAAMFVTTSQVGLVEKHPTRGDVKYMTWSQLRALCTRGHVIGNHCHTHRDLSRFPAEVVEAEIATARRNIQEELGPGPIPLAYPYGSRPAIPEDLVGLHAPFSFGSVKAPPAPWTHCPHLIRRTFLPTGEMARWPALVEGWRHQWNAVGSP